MTDMGSSEALRAPPLSHPSSPVWGGAGVSGEDADLGFADMLAREPQPQESAGPAWLLLCVSVSTPTSRPPAGSPPHLCLLASCLPSGSVCASGNVFRCPGC